MFSGFLGGNKQRLYISYYPRGATADDPVKFHTALLLVPKNPQDGSAKESYRFHVKNGLSNVGGVSKEVWEYEDKPTQNRTTQLWSVQLLGKLKKDVSDKSLSEFFNANVQVVQDDPRWRCRHWVWAAIQALGDAGIIELTQLPEEIWNAGIGFAGSVKPNPSQPVPTCDVLGKQVTSEIQ